MYICAYQRAEVQPTATQDWKEADLQSYQNEHLQDQVANAQPAVQSEFLLLRLIPFAPGSQR